jgi:hypothetical protein
MALVLVLGLVSPARAANPIITHIFTADPAALVHNDVVYLYTGHDEQAPGVSGFLMNDWHVFSSTDMATWTDHGEVLRIQNFAWAGQDAWAGHAIQRNGRFYWYVPVNGRDTATWMDIGVAVADSPTGPFTDAIGGPLITDRTPNSSALNIDPAVFVDDDGQAYMYWGSFFAPRMVRLNPNMISLNGPVMTPQGLTGFWEAPWLHKRNGIYYLSYAAGGNPATIEYATASSPLGPWTHRGRVLERTSSPTNHHAIFQYKGQWYIAYHTADAPGGGEFRRSVAVDLLFYNADGTIRTVVQTRTGVPPVGGGGSGPLAWYRFDEAGGTTATDSSGNGRTATLVGGAGRTAGRFGNAVNLDGVDDHVALPAGVVAGLDDFTVAAWVRLDTTGAWRRVLDLGSSTTVNMFLTTSAGAGGPPRFAITTGGAGAEQRISGSAPLPTGVWKHVAVTRTGATGILYVDGVEVGRNSAMTLRPSSLGSTTRNWIGRSQYAADAFLDGQVDDARIYPRGLTAAEVRTLFQGV